MCFECVCFCVFLFINFCVTFCSLFFFFKQKTAYVLRISDWSSDVCSSDLVSALVGAVWAGVLLGATGIVAPAGVLMVLLGGGALLRRRHRAAADAAQTATLIQEVCEVLAAELASGRPVGRCLEDAVALWEPMSSVAMAHQLGAPVPDALRVLAGRPGAGDLTLVAAAWQVTQRSGGGLADSPAEVAGTLRAARATRRPRDKTAGRANGVK